ncbi:MAG: glycosyltransferase family 4 protein, partial [Planctomycetota bacterium]
VNPGIIDSWGDAEGLGVGSIEAYNYQKPVIASAVGGIPDTVLHGETGFLVPQKDVNALAGAICDLLAEPEKGRQFGKAGYQFALRTFSWDRIIKKMEVYYTMAAEAGKRVSLKRQTAA